MTLEGKKLWAVVVLGLILVVLGGIWAVSSDNSSAPQAQTYEVPASQLEHARGKLDSDIVLYEYADYQCPACATYAPFVNQLAQEFGNEVKFVYKHFPLRAIHRNADISARAAVAASRQDKFWEFTDVLFAKQKDWENSNQARDMFVDYAKELGLNEQQFRADMDSDDTKEKVNGDYASALELGLNSTPTFILNGNRIQPQSYDDFRSFIQRAIDAGNGAGAPQTSSTEAQ